MGDVIYIDGDSDGGGVTFLGVFTNYTDLTTQHPTATVGQLAYVENSQGTKWLPGSFGGTFYSKGTYLWNGSIWDSAVDEIAQALEDLNLDNVVNINSLSDFPTPVAGVIELSQGIGTSTTYLIAAKEIDVSPNVFKNTGGDIVIRGVHRTASRLKTTSTTDFITSVDGNLILETVYLNNPNAKSVDFSSPTQLKSFVTQNLVILACTEIATISGAFTTSLRTMTVVSSSVGGILWTGSAGNQINISNFLGISWTGTLLDLGTATFSIIDILVGSRFTSPAGTTILSGLPNNGNLIAGGRGIVEGNLFNGIGTALSGLNTLDIKWNYKGNIFADGTTMNTLVVADTFLTSTETVTIGGGNQNVYFPVGGGNWASDIGDRFTVNTDGVMTYTGLETIPVAVHAVTTLEKTGGGADKICTKVAINGTVLDKTVACTKNSQETSVTSVGIVTLSTGDVIQTYVANTEGTSNIIVSEANLIVNSI